MLLCSALCHHVVGPATAGADTGGVPVLHLQVASPQPLFHFPVTLGRQRRRTATGNSTGRAQGDRDSRICGVMDSYDTPNHLLSKSQSPPPFQNRGFYFAGIGGLLLGLSVFAHPTSLVILPGFLVYAFLEMRRKNMGNFLFLVAVLLVVLLFAGLVNYARFNSFTEFGYGYYGSLAAHNGWKGLVGLLVSPGASLFLYFPVASTATVGGQRHVGPKQKKASLSLCFYHSHKLAECWHPFV